MKTPDGENITTGEGAPGLLGEDPRVKQKWIEIKNDGKDYDSKVKPSSLQLQKDENGSRPWKVRGSGHGSWWVFDHIKKKLWLKKIKDS